MNTAIVICLHTTVGGKRKIEEGRKWEGERQNRVLELERRHVTISREVEEGEEEVRGQIIRRKQYIHMLKEADIIRKRKQYKLEIFY